MLFIRNGNENLLSAFQIQASDYILVEIKAKPVS
jgi:hypothetical protein